MKALIESGYNVPDDISIIGFDNAPLCVYSNPKLTTVKVPNHYMGQIAVERLIQIINSHINFPLKIEIDTTIIVRDSVVR